MNTMSDSAARISKIAGRYLVFDPDAVSRLRRQHNINGLLVGTTPQQPTQNIFLGLPIELRPEEAAALVSAGAAFVVDDAAAHRDALFGQGGRKAGTNAYVEALRRQKTTAQRAIMEQKAQRAVEAAHKQKNSRSKPKPKASGAAVILPEAEASIFEGDASHKQLSSSKHVAHAPKLAITPTSSDDLISPELYAQHTVSSVPDGPLCRLLQRTGYFMTPGLRFGSQYSVYPGDPLRFHAHFMANEYGWDEPIPTLEIVEGGRLATAVKKAFLIGGRRPDDGSGEEDIRTFSLEWAAM